MNRQDAEAIKAALTALAQAVVSRIEELEARVAALEKEPRRSLAQKLRERK